MTEQQLRRLRSRAHVHSDNCYGRYEPCGEHHMHDNTCGSRSLICGNREDEDLISLLEEFDRLRSKELTTDELKVLADMRNELAGAWTDEAAIQAERDVLDKLLGRRQ